ncbi:PREDICTED: uncharacterized protein LOC109223285 [Nicotiana attenuata]|uniref:Uncharacterized protein n=1 Tax=Nicotiana attenuata TaxID=49451 RepID=A0A1J6IHM5_NICAT|nr:PREDICTED: uncharacterized protein LOC109223285 [Nicotiana attenuata]OIT04374.1 hypothetical protein A4A49_18378 [Nicotiana attenuata]
MQSGYIYFYNTRTQKRTSRDPRLSPEPQSPDHMSLDLQLNLPCGSSENNQVVDNFNKRNSVSNSSYSGGDAEIKRRGIAHSLSWLTFDGDQQEMFTAVCKKYHVLVMMCKSSPSCPNCKFINPAPDLSTPTYPVQEKAMPLMFNERSILVTKD